MTCREKLKIEHPEMVTDCAYGGCIGCPFDYKYLDINDTPCLGMRIGHKERCTACWNQEIPEQKVGHYINLFEEYKQLCHVDEKYIDGWSPYGKDTIKVRFTDGKEIIWTLHSSDHWSMETLEHYYQRIAAIRNV